MNDLNQTQSEDTSTQDLNALQTQVAVNQQQMVRKLRR